MSQQNGNGSCLIVLLVILFSEALLPLVCLPVTLPFIIADADPKTRQSILTVLAIIIVVAIWFWLKSRLHRNKGDHK